MTNSALGKKTAKTFVLALLQWNQNENDRPMPWKGEVDPYKIWLSEIILQQTRVEQGLAYYQRFVKTFPDVHSLAAAPDQQVFKLWEGLGYYTRCKNLLATARYISKELKGVFPKDYAGIVQLKGVGPYTAAAIASFAYNLPYAVLDGNVFRVLSRIFNDDTPTDTNEGKKHFAALAQSLLPNNHAGTYNQAIMDFGATICKPMPDCANCFFNRGCHAFFASRQLELPIKQKKTSVKERWFNYFILQHGNQYAIRQRTEKDIWQSLFEFILIETSKAEKKKTLLLQLQKSYGVAKDDYTVTKDFEKVTQRLSHQLIHFQFFLLHINVPPASETLQWVSATDLLNYPFPKTLQQLLPQILKS
jgi:A/G-specific adenine glycosylase